MCRECLSQLYPQNSSIINQTENENKIKIIIIDS
uniref:Uncharacterized protein n=1 Tax=Anguilla anguilla TaxID=7936 RepID=A0A0E9PMM4_ANGAN